jgi:5-oxoprolinase (ATP-hydrolysing)
MVDDRLEPSHPARWEFWIDRGGTFTDCIARAPDGALHIAKRLSSDSAPAQAVREILERVGGVPAGGPLPPCSVKLGSTVATNALLERRGAETVLVTNRGFEDLLEIGTQERPELFELRIERPPALHREAIGCAARVGVDGERIAELDADALRGALAAARARGRTASST